jgi:hypothetical protein
MKIHYTLKLNLIFASLAPALFNQCAQQKNEVAQKPNIRRTLKGKLRELQDKYGDLGVEYSELQEVIKNYW